MKLVRITVLAVLGASLLACQPTGDVRCDRQWDILFEIEAEGWTIDCAPDFDNIAGSGPREGQRLGGWADHSRSTVWVWPEAMPTNDQLRKLMWHELGHVVGNTDETDADIYAYCREPGLDAAYGFGSIPSAAECERVGAARRERQVAAATVTRA